MNVLKKVPVMVRRCHYWFMEVRAVQAVVKKWVVFAV